MFKRSFLLELIVMLGEVPLKMELVTAWLESLYDG
jgi:hypothetical protein